MPAFLAAVAVSAFRTSECRSWLLLFALSADWQVQTFRTSPVFELLLAVHSGFRPWCASANAARRIPMEQAVPAAISLQVVQHDGAVRASVAQLTLRELAGRAAPDMCSSFALEELTAVDCGVLQDVLHLVAGVALEDVAVFCVALHETLRAFCMEAVPCGVAQVLRQEVSLRPRQLPGLRGTARTCTRVHDTLVQRVATFCGLLACADLAADVTFQARDAPALLHVFGELRG